MKNDRTISILFRFYKSYLPSALAVTIFCLYLFFRAGMSLVTGIFWLKMISYGLIYFFIRTYKKKQFYYYRNLGFSNLALWGSTLSFDFLLFLLSLFIIYILS